MNIEEIRYNYYQLIAQTKFAEARKLVSEQTEMPEHTRRQLINLSYEYGIAYERKGKPDDWAEMVLISVALD